MSGTFETFIDGDKFKYTEDGNIALNYDNSSWRNVLLNNMLLEDYMYSQYIVPQTEITPVYDMNVNKKIEKYLNNDKHIDKNIIKNKNNKNNKNKYRLSRKKNIDKIKKNIRLNNIFDNYDSNQNEIKEVMWIKNYCDICGVNEETNNDDLCIFCEFYNEYMEVCPSCNIYNGSGDICLLCRSYLYD